MNRKEQNLNDRWLFLLYPLIAISVVHIGNDNSLNKLIRLPSYYSDLFLALICAFGFGLFLRKLVKKIDAKYDWNSGLKERLIYQSIWGIVFPTLIIVIIEFLYLLLIDIKWDNTSILYLELPLTALFCTLVNLIYIILYFRKHTILLNRAKENAEQVLFRENFVIRLGAQVVNIPKEEVAYFTIQDRVTFLITTAGKKYFYDFSLRELVYSLAPQEFFQLNRQIIAKKSSILKYIQTDTRRLEIQLKPPLEQQIFLSKVKASEFFKWLNSK